MPGTITPPGQQQNPPLLPPLVTGTAVVTDQGDYAPGTTAHIRGQVFQAGETVSLQVLHADGTPSVGQDHLPWTVVADADGGFHATWHVCEDDCVGSALRLTAVGVVSGKAAQALFSDAPAAPTFQLLKSFGSPSPGGGPYGGLMKGADGALYGTAVGGGTSGFGTVFKVNPDGTGYTVLKNFDSSTTGANPYSGLVQGADGALYGTAYNGGSSGAGTVFKLFPDGTGFSVLKNFDWSTTGGYLQSGLILGSDGVLYGTASMGGGGSYGTLFKLNPDGTGFSILKYFTDDAGGGSLLSSLIQGPDGTLYGMAQTGGSNGYGTVFKLNTDGTGFTVLKGDFDYSAASGGFLSSGLLLGADGALYGTSQQGGSSGYGAVFKLNADGTGFAVLASFDYSTIGGFLYTGLMQGTDGALYGMAAFGGSGNAGTVFKVNPDGTGFSVVKNLDYSTTGAYPQGSKLIQGTDGALYGEAYQGGSIGAGTLFKLNADGTGFDVLKNLTGNADISIDGGSPRGGVVQGTDGALYGTTSGGGSSGAGTAFRLNTDGTGFSVLQNLDSFTTGGSPNSAVVQGTDGALYGTATTGGAGGGGTVFNLSPDGASFSVLKNLDYSTTGAYPQTGLILGSDGALYGTAQQGGTTGNGTVFKLNADGSGFSVIKSFGLPSPGASSWSRLIKGTDGALYGTAQGGGSDTSGTVFKLNADGTGFTVLKNLDYSMTGGYPVGGLIQGTDGALYGTASLGGSSNYGTVFKLNTDGTGFTTIMNFDYYTTGGYLYSGLMQGTDGKLYGMAWQGGSGGFGTVFKLSTDGTSFAILKNFDYWTTGGDLWSGLMQGMDGALYGTASDGGASGYGTVFKLNMDGTGFSILQNFDHGTTGGFLYAGLMQGTDGALYGTAGTGGSSGYGTVFKLNMDGTGFTVLDNFDSSTTGGIPRAGVIQGTDGVLYGTTYQGGTIGYGTVFKLNTDGTGFSTVKSYDYSTTGGYLYSGLMQGTDGTLYGTASQGGSSSSGTVFKLNTDGTGFSVLKNLAFGPDLSEDGGQPQAGLIQGTDGALYGEASVGGSIGAGTVFKLNTDGTGFTVLQNFDGGTSGGNPAAGLLQGMDGALYGTTQQGGSNLYYGTLFKLNTDGTGFSVLENFDYYTTGSYPNGALVQRADGTIYGTATYGGSSGYGTVFQLNPDGSDFSVVLNFDKFSSGSAPSGRLTKGTDGNLYGTTAQGGNGAGTVYRLVFGGCAGAVDGTACDDGNPCTQTDTCQAGVCTGSNPVICTASDQCHTAGTCDTGTGTCSNPAKADGSSCSDGNACTTNDTCLAGTCTGGPPANCDDRNVCTIDSCSPSMGCMHTPGNAGAVCRASAGVCDPAETCTGTDATCPGDAKSTAVCRASSGVCDVPESCDGVNNNCPADGFQSSATVCRPAAGQCDVAETCTGMSAACPMDGHASDGTSCSDGNACTQADTCQAGVCRSLSFAWTGVLQPINGDGTSIFKLGSTVPVKFKLTSPCVPIGTFTAKIFLAKITNSVLGSEVEATSTAAADTGNTFRYDASGDQYIYNLATKAFTNGSTTPMSAGTWQIRIAQYNGNMEVVTMGTVTISLSR
jgi:uncharacterized repeat protein (TIGR03803 family)